MRFEIKIDFWLKLLLWGLVFSTIPMLFFVPEDEIYILFLTTILMAFLILPMMYFSYYELRDEYLYIQISFIRMKVKYRDVTGVRAGKYSMVNNMAFSLEAVIIERKNKKFGEIAISPEDREIFIYELRRRCPQLNDIRVLD